MDCPDKPSLALDLVEEFRSQKMGLSAGPERSFTFPEKFFSCNIHHPGHKISNFPEGSICSRQGGGVRMVMKGGPYRRIVKGLFLLGLFGLFFSVEATQPLHPRLSRNNLRYAPLREYFDLQAPLPAVAETSDEYDAYGEWDCLLGPFPEDREPGDRNLFAEPQGSPRADRGALSLPISRSPPIPIPGQ